MEGKASAPQRSYEEYDDDYGAQRKNSSARTGRVEGQGGAAARPAGGREATARQSTGSSPPPRHSPGISPPPKPRPDAPNGSAAAGIRARLIRPDSSSQLDSTAPHNSMFVTPIFPQLPITVTSSSNSWAIMLEQACQTLEGIFGPLLEAVLCECSSTGLIPADKGTLAPPARSPRIINTSIVAAAAAKAAASCASNLTPTGAPGARGSAAEPGKSPGDVSAAAGRQSGSGVPETPEKFEIPHPPYDAATCVDLLLRHDWLSYNKFPVTIRKRLETASAAVAQLLKEPESLNGSSVVAAEQAIKGIIQDCLKAMGLPSLLGAGSRQFMAFVRHIKPEFESQLIYLDTLIADAQEMEARTQPLLPPV